jgi:hypothetical protein
VTGVVDDADGTNERGDDSRFDTFENRSGVVDFAIRQSCRRQYTAAIGKLDPTLRFSQSFNDLLPGRIENTFDFVKQERKPPSGVLLDSIGYRLANSALRASTHPTNIALRLASKADRRTYSITPRAEFQLKWAKVWHHSCCNAYDVMRLRFQWRCPFPRPEVPVCRSTHQIARPCAA